MLVPAPYFVSPLLPLNFRWLPRHTTVAGGSTRQSLLFLAKLRKKEATRTLFIGVKLHSKLKVGCFTILYILCFRDMYIVFVCENHDDYGGDTKESRSSVTQWQYTTMPHVYSWGYLGWWWCQVIRSLLHQNGPAQREYAGECHSYFATLQCRTKSHNLIRKKSINFSKHSNELSCDCDCLLLSSNIHAWL